MQLLKKSVYECVYLYKTLLFTEQPCPNMTISNSINGEISGVYGDCVLVPCRAGYQTTDQQNSFVTECNAGGIWNGSLFCTGMLNYCISQFDIYLL